jgi:tetratricopeptide (TPR) repeat protein
MKLREAIKRLRKEGLAADLKPVVLWHITQDVLSGEPSEFDSTEILTVLDAYYCDQSNLDRALKDGYIRHDWRFGQETDDLIAELSALLGGKAIFVQEKNNPGMISVRRDDGTKFDINVESGGMVSVVEFFNTELERRGDARRFYAMETNGDWHAYYLLPKTKFENLSKLRLLPFEGMPPPDPEVPARILTGALTTTSDFELRAKKFLQLKDYEKALGDFREFITRVEDESPSKMIATPGITRALVECASINLILGKFDEAVVDAARIIELNKEYPASHTRGRAGYILRGRALCGLGQHKEALDDFLVAQKMAADVEINNLTDGAKKALKAGGGDKPWWWPF